MPPCMMCWQLCGDLICLPALYSERRLASAALFRGHRDLVSGCVRQVWAALQVLEVGVLVVDVLAVVVATATLAGIEVAFLGSELGGAAGECRLDLASGEDEHLEPAGHSVRQSRQKLSKRNISDIARVVERCWIGINPKACANVVQNVFEIQAQDLVDMFSPYP